MTMPAISLDQPWASLCVTRQKWQDEVRNGAGWELFERPAPMVKRFETRGWPCPPNLIGQRIALHATQQTVTHGTQVGDWTVRNNGIVMKPDLWLHHVGPYPATPLPLGAVVGSATIEACYPIYGLGTCPGPPLTGHPQHVCVGPFLTDGVEAEPDVQLLLVTHMHDVARNISDQLPYGDFTPGRFAWLLTDAAPTNERCPWCWGTGSWPKFTRQVCRVCSAKGRCGPIPCKGRQRIWRWEP